LEQADFMGRARTLWNFGKTNGSKRRFVVGAVALI
jgi:hypothetical protein